MPPPMQMLLEAKTFDRPAKLTISVLMSTYAGETAANLQQSLASLSDQSVPPDEVVLVIDGPIPADQEAVIAAFSASSIPISVVRLAQCGGLARAMNLGLESCDGEWVMRMDSDDICLSDRIAVQTAYAERHPEIDVVSSWAEDFFPDGARPQIKIAPTEHEHVMAALRWRNVIVHPSVLIRTSVLRRVRGYRSNYGMLEDYDLYVRLAMTGAKFHIIPKVLVRVRANQQQRSRRGGLRYFLGEIGFRAECRRVGFMTTAQFLIVTALYGGFRLVSGAMRGRLYSLVRT